MERRPGLRAVRDYAGAFIRMGGFGEVLPRYENQIDLDPARKDAWGIPVIRFGYRFGYRQGYFDGDRACFSVDAVAGEWDDPRLETAFTRDLTRSKGASNPA